MKRFVEGEDRRQGALLPHCLDDYVTENNPVRVIEASSTNWIWRHWALTVSSPRPPDARLTIQRRY